MNPAPTPGTSKSSLQPWAARLRRRWLTWLLLLVIFVSGAAVGAAGALLVLRQQVLNAIHNPRQTASRVAQHISRKLDLDPEQSRRVAEIVNQRQQALQAIRREVQPRVEGELSQLEKQIAEVLNEKQKEKWHATCDSYRRLWLPPVPD